MVSTTKYNSPIGELLLTSKDGKLIGLWIEKQKYFLGDIKEEMQENAEEPILIKTKKWLDKYFNGEKPQISDLDINLEYTGSEFAQNVWKLLCGIPYGKVVTYGELAKKVARKMNKSKMSAQAVGGAVGHNPIGIIVPCHRVVGANGSLTGYAGGIDKKIKLLELENVGTKNGVVKFN